MKYSSAEPPPRQSRDYRDITAVTEPSPATFSQPATDGHRFTKAAAYRHGPRTGRDALLPPRTDAAVCSRDASAAPRAGNRMVSSRYSTRHKRTQADSRRERRQHDAFFARHRYACSDIAWQEYSALGESSPIIALHIAQPGTASIHVDARPGMTRQFMMLPRLTEIRRTTEYRFTFTKSQPRQKNI